MHYFLKEQMSMNCNQVLSDVQEVGDKMNRCLKSYPFLFLVAVFLNSLLKCFRLHYQLRCLYYWVLGALPPSGISVLPQEHLWLLVFLTAAAIQNGNKYSVVP